MEKFQISIHEISPHEEEFQFYHTTDVEKCEILPNLEKFPISPQDSDTCGHPEVERHGPGQERTGHPRQRGLCLEGRLPRERRSLAPPRHALGGDEVHLLRLQGNGQLRQREFFKCPRFRTVRQNVKRNIVRN